MPRDISVRWILVVAVHASLCVPKTSSKLCDQAIFVDQATDAIVSSDAVLLKIDRFGQRFRRRGAVQGAVRPMLLVVDLVLAQDPLQMVLVPTRVSRRFCRDCPGNSAGRHRACPSGLLDDPCQSCSFCCLRAHLVACRRDSTDFMRHSYLDDPPSATSCARKDSAGCCAAPSPRPASARPPPAVTPPCRSPPSSTSPRCPSAPTPPWPSGC